MVIKQDINRQLRAVTLLTQAGRMNFTGRALDIAMEEKPLWGSHRRWTNRVHKARRYKSPCGWDANLGNNSL